MPGAGCRVSVSGQGLATGHRVPAADGRRAGVPAAATGPSARVAVVGRGVPSGYARHVGPSRSSDGAWRVPPGAPLARALRIRTGCRVTLRNQSATPHSQMRNSARRIPHLARHGQEWTVQAPVRVPARKTSPYGAWAVFPDVPGRPLYVCGARVEPTARPRRGGSRCGSAVSGSGQDVRAEQPARQWAVASALPPGVHRLGNALGLPRSVRE